MRTAHPRSLAAALGSLVLLACHVDAKVNASAPSDSEPSGFSDPAATPPPASSSLPVADAPTSPAAAPAGDACPLTCFEARGSERASLTTEETAQLRASLEPVLGRMRSCASGDEWRRRGSPTLNLRIAPDGTLAELGVDPGYAGVSSCFYEPAQGTGMSLALPGRKVVRCAERCQREPAQRSRRSTRPR